MDRCIAVSLGSVDYADAWELQKDLHQRVSLRHLPALLLFVEHAHVYTLGRRGKSSDVLADDTMLSGLGVDVHYTDRGGEVTYHGPGQLVAYPIIDLRAKSIGPLQYVRSLEAAIIATLAEFGIEGRSDGKPTGVWVGAAKMAAIGVKVSRGVTMHGLALNVATDLSYFDHIVPCGVAGSRATSMALLLPAKVETGQVASVLAEKFAEAFGYELEWSTIEEIDATPALGVTP